MNNVLLFPTIIFLNLNLICYLFKLSYFLFIIVPNYCLGKFTGKKNLNKFIIKEKKIRGVRVYLVSLPVKTMHIILNLCT